jgi:hypothetical protein
MSEKENENENGWGAGVKTALIALPILYVLSIGPVYYAATKLKWTDERAFTALDAFYLPLFWLHDHTPLERPLEWYTDLWLRERP